MQYESYTSDELTHFLGRRCSNDDERYRLLVKILRSGQLRPSGISGASDDTLALLSIVGNKRLSDETAIQGQIVCFCDIPRSGWGLHMGKYSCFGVAFSKSFLVARGANPAFYVVKDAVVPGISAIPSGSGSIELRRDVTRAELLDQIHAEAMALSTPIRDMMFSSDNPELAKLLFRVEHLRQQLYEIVLAFIKPFDSAEPEGSRRNFYMEREWRVYGDVRFQMADVRRIILPASYVECFREEFPDFVGDVTPA